MLGGNFIGCAHASLFLCKTKPCWSITWSDRVAGLTEDRTIPAVQFARSGETSAPSKLPAKPSFRVTETVPDHDHGESPSEAPPDAGFRTLASSRSADPGSSLEESPHRFFFRRASARSIERGLIETPKRFWMASVTSFSAGESACHCPTKSRISAVHL
jgi:hypothetical protein